MRRLFIALALWSPVVALLAGGAPGCANSCDDLAEICSLCTDADYRENCEQTVAANNQEVCNFRRSELMDICLGEETSSSSSGNPLPTGSGGSSAGGATSAGGAGASGGSGGTTGAGGNASGGAGGATGSGGTGG
ncbi:MAG: hypothetical protein R3B72_29235 [Polyangiaceae bacterium]